MNDLFVDTSGWAALADQSQPEHSLATQIYQEVQNSRHRRKFITTNYIITELVSLLISRVRYPHKLIVEYVTKLEASSYVEIIHIDRDLHSRSLGLFSARPKKLWSLVDCSSFVVMQERGITEALTTDQHFEQASFVRLLK